MSARLVPDVRALYSRLPETRYLQAWTLQHALFSLGYPDDLADEAEIAAAVELAQEDWSDLRAA